MFIRMLGEMLFPEFIQSTKINQLKNMNINLDDYKEKRKYLVSAPVLGHVPKLARKSSGEPNI